jgi:hypothetical protein
VNFVPRSGVPVVGLGVAPAGYCRVCASVTLPAASRANTVASNWLVPLRAWLSGSSRYVVSPLLVSTPWKLCSPIWFVAVCT